MPHASKWEDSRMTDGQIAGPSAAAFLVSLEKAPAALLMLDYDGTLAPFRVDPAQARPYPGIAETLEPSWKRAARAWSS